jgi:hypothetical protein
MCKKIWPVLGLLMFVLVANTFGQKFKVLEGNKEILKGQKEINVLFDYSHLAVGKFDDEADYITKKKADYNKKESGKGTTWEKAWKGDRTKRYEPQFIELFNKYGEGMEVGNFASAKYTMTVTTTFTEPGYNIAISRKNAEINGEIIITETGNPDKVVLKISYKGAQGKTFGGGDYDTGLRIQEAYAKLGKELGQYFN